MEVDIFILGKKVDGIIPVEYPRYPTEVQDKINKLNPVSICLVDIGENTYYRLNFLNRSPFYIKK